MNLFQNLNQELAILAKVAFTVVLCALVGLEREKLKKPAGLCTNMIVRSAACL